MTWASAGDRAIGFIGPVFIFLAIILLSTCIIAFYTVILPFNHSWTEETTVATLIYGVMTFFFSIYMVWSIFFHYYMAIMVNPNGKGTSIGKMANLGTAVGNEESEALLEMEEAVQATIYKKCKKCHSPKPERTHHCSVCNRCILKFDHHCPWINNCVGHHNHRYFILFMTYVVVGAGYIVFAGWRPFLASLDFTEHWQSEFSRAIFAFSMVLATAMGLALAGLCGWHYYLVLSAQTTVESFNNHHDKFLAKQRNEIFFNPYDFGYTENFKNFFNIGQQYRWWTLFVPWPVPPKGNGSFWEKRMDVLASHHRY